MQEMISPYPRLIANLILALCLSSCDSNTVEVDNPTKQPTRPVKLLEIKHNDTPIYVRYPALIHSKKLTELSFEQSGVLNELFVVEAQYVNEGDILASLDQRGLKDKLASAHAEFNNHNSNYKRATRLIGEGAISRSELEKRKSERDISQSQLNSAEKDLQDTVLLAPYAGNISKVSLKKHQTIQAGNPAITILGQGGLQAKINVPSSAVAHSKGKARDLKDNYLIVGSAPSIRIPIQFKEASLEADPTSQTYEITFSFTAPDDLIVLPGMSATLWLKTSTASTEQVLIKIPLSAITTIAEKNYVWLLNRKDMSVSKQPIEVEQSVGAELTILSGLTTGDVIVISGLPYLSEGMKVRSWSH